MIQKNDFYNLLNQMISSEGTMGGESATELTEFSKEEIREIEQCVQLTPKIPSMYAIRHIETLFDTVLEQVKSLDPAEMQDADLMPMKTESNLPLSPIHESEKDKHPS